MQSMMADMDNRMQQMMSGMMNDSPFGRSNLMRQNMNMGMMSHPMMSGMMNPRMEFGFNNMVDSVDSPGNHRQRHVVVTSQVMGPDGRMRSENYYTNEVTGLTSDGQKISQKEEMYKNDQTGEKKISQEKALNGLVHKVTKRQKTGSGRYFL